jgi:hypothetical protein
MRSVRAAAAARNTSGEEVVLDLPHVVESEPVGQLHLGEGVLQESVLRALLLPRSGVLMLVEDPKAHFRRDSLKPRARLPDVL